LSSESAAVNCSDQFSLHFHILSLLALLGRDCCRLSGCFRFLLPLVLLLLWVLQQLLPALLPRANKVGQQMN
jgi:hypothetical protein